MKRILITLAMLSTLASAQPLVRVLGTQELPPSRGTDADSSNLALAITNLERRNADPSQKASLVVMLSIFDPATGYSWIGPLWGAQSDNAGKEWDAFRKRCKVYVAPSIGINCICVEGGALWLTKSTQMQTDPKTALANALNAYQVRGLLEGPVQTWKSIVYHDDPYDVWWTEPDGQGLGRIRELRVDRVQRNAKGLTVEIIYDRTGEKHTVQLGNNLELIPAVKTP